MCTFFDKVDQPFFGFFHSMIVLLLVAALIGCGGGGSGESTHNSTEHTGEVVTESVTPDGGTIRHPKGFSVEFPENCVSSPIEVSIEDVAVPQSLPHTIPASSLAFKASPEGMIFDEPVKITFSNTAFFNASDQEASCLFRWNGSAWISLGTFVEDNVVSAFTEGFSIFVAGKPEDIWKKFEFFNYGTEPANLIPWTWTLNNTQFNAYPFGVSVNVPGAPNNWTNPAAWLPQGCYTFCYEFELYNVNTLNWIVVHNFKGVEWDTCLSEIDSLVVPPVVFIDTTYGYQNGPCPAPPGPAGGNSGGGGGGGTSIAGTWPATINLIEKVTFDDGEVWGPYEWDHSFDAVILQDGSNFTIVLPDDEDISGSIDGDTVSGSLPWDIDDVQCPPIGMGGTISGNTLTMSGSGSCRSDYLEKTWDSSVVVVVTMSQ